MKRRKDPLRLEYRIARCGHVQCPTLRSDGTRRATVCIPNRLIASGWECHRCSPVMFNGFAVSGAWSPGAVELFAIETDNGSHDPGKVGAVVGAVLRLYLRQFGAEVSGRETIFVNGVGANVPDGHVLTSVAEYVVASDLLGFADRDRAFVEASHELARDYLENGYDPERHRMLVGARFEDARARLYKYAEQLATLAEVGFRVA